MSKQIQSDFSPSEALDVVERQLSAISDHHHRGGGTVHVRAIAPSFGAFLRSDTTIINVTTNNRGLDVRSNTEMSPTAWFWVATIAGLWAAGIGSIVPFVLYQIQKSEVKKALRFALDGVELEMLADEGQNEYDEEFIADEIAKLAILCKEGIITKSEFNKQKRFLIG